VSQLTVATFNLYLGADLQPLFGAATPEELARRAVSLWQQVMDGDPGARMRAASAIVVQALPDVLAVQEAVRWTATGPDGEVLAELDQLALLQAGLAELGHPYRVVSTAESFSSDGLPMRSSGLGAVALADSGALLVRDGTVENGTVEVVATAAGRYAVAMPLPVLGGTMPLVRGWCSADLRHDGHTVRVVATHLEAFDASVRVAQVRELLGGAAHQGASLATVVLGDLNCRAPAERGAGGHASQAGVEDAYEVVQQSGLRDAWLTADRHEGDPAGGTCRPESGMTDPSCRFDHRIDLVFASRRLRVRRAVVLGGDPDDRTAEGRWPSDHGCLVVDLDLE
jgi:endonuclease/exonuclease/phosphatase family metal-dependent hydrolase